MKLGIVVGQVVATRKDDRLSGCKLMITQPITPEGAKTGATIVAVDTVGAGVGEKVLFTSGSAAARAMRELQAPVDATIVAIVDRIDNYEKRSGTI